MYPKKHDVFQYKYSQEVGELESENHLYTALNKLMKKYKANRYDMLTFNCNHFTNEFLQHLTGKGLPRHLNRAAYVGSYLHCIVPRKYLTVTPQTVNYDIITSSTKTCKEKNVESDEEYEECSSDDDQFISTEASSVTTITKSSSLRKKTTIKKITSKKSKSCRNKFLKFLKLA